AVLQISEQRGVRPQIVRFEQSVRHAQTPGSARVPRAGERVLAIANFSWRLPSSRVTRYPKKRLFRRDAETSTRDACVTQIAIRSRYFLTTTAFSIIATPPRSANFPCTVTFLPQ